jgi:stage II sporulation protein E
VTEEKDGRGRLVRITLPTCGGKGVCRDKILPLVKKVLDRPMVLLEEGTCKVDGEGHFCMLSFREEPAFAIHTATAFAPAENGRPTGDAAAFLETEKGRALLALSDGMGSGRDAERVSSTSLSLIESFYKAGLSSQLILGTVNKLLSINTEDTFTALDVCVVDLNTCTADFIKYGCPYGFILGDKGIRIVEGSSLPLGIIDELKPAVCSATLNDGDVVSVRNAFGWLFATEEGGTK